MVQIPTKSLTLAEFLQLPETEPASEYINGQITKKPMPQGKHSKLQGRLVTVINDIVEKPQIALALPELRCTFGGLSIIPDIAVFTWNRIPCLNAGCQIGWLVDPVDKSVLAFPAHQQPIFLELEQLLPTPEFIGDFRLSVGELFGWLKIGV